MSLKESVMKPGTFLWRITGKEGTFELDDVGAALLEDLLQALLLLFCIFKGAFLDCFHEDQLA